LVHATLSRRAKADVRVIWNYTVEHWGLNQAEIYLGLIEAAVDSIANDPNTGRPCDEVRPGHRRYLVGSHVLFYRMKANRVFVVRILHQRMDVERHL
jgi:toxin ParE1/3/4